MLAKSNNRRRYAGRLVSRSAVDCIGEIGQLNVSFSESERTAPRPPIQFSLGLMKETSTEFLPITPLATKLHADNCCILKDTSYFIEQPIYFLFASNKWPCDGDMRCQAEYCRLCEENGFFLSKVRRHEKNNQKSLH